MVPAALGEAAIPAAISFTIFLLIDRLMDEFWGLDDMDIWGTLFIHSTSMVAQKVKNLPEMQKTQIQTLCQEDPLEKAMATHSIILSLRIPWREDPGRL